MIPRAILRKRLPSHIASSPLRRVVVQQWRTNIPPPKADDGPLMERRADRDLPEIPRSKWAKTLPIFVAIIAISSIAIFNYQKMTSSVVTSTLYSLRKSEKARSLLGDEIYFKNSIPWISGEMNQLNGKIDISFKVKGTKSSATMRFKSFRPTARGLFETTEWSLETEDGRIIDLLEEDDAFKAITLSDEDIHDVEEENRVKGFRKSSYK